MEAQFAELEGTVSERFEETGFDAGSFVVELQSPAKVPADAVESPAVGGDGGYGACTDHRINTRMTVAETSAAIPARSRSTR